MQEDFRNISFDEEVQRAKWFKEDLENGKKGICGQQIYSLVLLAPKHTFVTIVSEGDETVLHLLRSFHDTK